MIREDLKEFVATLPNKVTLVAATKYIDIDDMEILLENGVNNFGENRVDSFLRKYDLLKNKDIVWHFIGHLQTNKVKQIVPFVHLIQSVDSWHLLEVINAEAAKVGRVVNVLLEVHVAKEETKTGFDLSSFHPFSHSALPNVQILGLMAMATNTDDETEIRRCFREAKAIKEEVCQRSGLPAKRSFSDSGLSATAVLSIGMSDDYLLAIEEGSTMVRIGTAIFGPRQY